MIRTAVISFVLVLAAVNVQAADKIVVFSLEQAILNTNEARKALAGLQASAEYASLKAKAEGLIADLKKLRDEQTSKSMTWTQEQMAEHRKKVEFINADLDLARRKLGAEEQAAVTRVAESMQGRIQTILKQIIESDGIGLVLPLRNDTIVYLDPEMDITPKVTAALNKAQ